MPKFEYEELRDNSGHPVFLVRITNGWGYDVLGVVRQAHKERFPGLGLRWTAALSPEADPSLWDKKATSSGYEERDHAAIWLLGARQGILNPHNTAARALWDWQVEQNSKPDKCPACGELVIRDYNAHPQIDSSATIPGKHRDEIRCQNCEVEVFRERWPELPYRQKHPWQLVHPVSEHPADCRFCASGESSQHNYEPPQPEGWKHYTEADFTSDHFGPQP